MKLSRLSQPLLLLLLPLLCCITPASSQSTYLSNGWWMDQPYDGDHYNRRVEYLDNITLTCEENDTFPPPNDTTLIQYWVLPDLRVMKEGDYLQYYTLDGYAAWAVSDDTRLLYVTRVQEPQFGFYHCHLQLGNDTHPTPHVIKKAINYKGPFFDNLWDKYRLNTIIACSAAGGLLVIIICIYVVYLYRYQEPEEGDVEESDELTGDGEKGGDPSTHYDDTEGYNTETDIKHRYTELEKTDDKDNKVANNTDGHQNPGYDAAAEEEEEKDGDGDGEGGAGGGVAKEGTDAEGDQGMTEL